jgi:hypothetical protein
LFFVKVCCLSFAREAFFYSSNSHQLGEREASRVTRWVCEKHVPKFGQTHTFVEMNTQLSMYLCRVPLLVGLLLKKTTKINARARGENSSILVTQKARQTMPNNVRSVFWNLS